MKRIKFILGSLFGTLALMPALAFAQYNVQSGLGGFLEWFKSLMVMVIPILIGLGVIVFLWGVLRFIFNAGDEEKRKEGRNFMIWGIIGIAVMVSVWGLVNFLQSTFGLQSANESQVGPGIPSGIGS